MQVGHYNYIVGLICELSHMRVKKLDLFGFKSFASRQSLNFGEGITCVVGPNGCGKSNVVDALRWVMGEQNARHLRGGVMQDIIFCGSEKKSPLGFAEVTLTLNNEDKKAPLDYNHYEEIQITRRLYKSGDSEYEINKQKARLKDISEFFLGTGVGTKAYSIIEQGRINEVISAKPLERRSMIEEAAGITKYKAKKVLAERRMEATRQNLDRIIDIRTEVDKRVSVLAREKSKLLELCSLKEKLANLDIHVASHRYLDIQARLTYKKNNRQRIEDETKTHKQELAFKEQAFSSILASYSSKHEQRRTLEELSLHHHNAQELLKKDLEYAKRTLSDNDVFIARVESQLSDLKTRHDELLKHIDFLKEEHESSDDKLLNIKDEVTKKKDSGQEVVALRQHHVVKERDIQAKIVQAASDAARLQAEISAEQDKEAQRRIESKNLGLEIELKDAEIAQKDIFIKTLSKEQAAAEERQAELRQKLSQKEQEIEALSKEIAEKSKTLLESEALKNKLSSRLSSLQEIDQQLEWSESGVIALRSKDKDLIKGVLADAVSVSPGFEDIVEKCLAHLLDTALIGDANALKQAAKLLSTHKSQSTAFFLLEEQEKPLASLNALLSLSKYIAVDARFKSLETRLARYYIADNLEEALKHWQESREKYCYIATKDGEMLSPDGRAVILGQNSKQGVLKRKNEQLELENKISNLNNELNNIKNYLNEQKSANNALEQEKSRLLDELKPLSLGLIRLEESLKQKRADYSRAEAELKKLQEKLLKFKETVTSHDEKQSERQKNWADALSLHRELEEELEEIKYAQIKSEQDYENYLNELRAIEINKAGLSEKVISQKAALEETQKNLLLVKTQQETLITHKDEKLDEELKLKETERQAEKKIADLDKELIEIGRQLSSIIAECKTLTEQKEAHELSLASSKTSLEKSQALFYQEELLVKDLENEIVNLSERLYERHKIKLAHHICDYHLLPIDEVRAKKEMDELRRTLDRMGSVNENAAVEYEEFKKRQDFLVAQISDLEGALEQLTQAINKINKTTKMRFEEAFNGINKHFQVVFPRLFNGGRAELVLTDQDMLCAGVDILAKPPGKNIGSIELMSGGEKALTAISLIMAIFLIKPSPFCLLDEVDAPLDEANVARFSQLIKEMSARSQFIVITHNRKTMEAADQLYGVTMEDAGSSKVVSVEVQQAFESLKLNQNKAKAPKKAIQLSLDDVA